MIPIECKHRQLLQRNRMCISRVHVESELPDAFIDFPLEQPRFSLNIPKLVFRKKSEILPKCWVQGINHETLSLG